jgi:DNA-binding beta-propeller fold protein YncE
MAMFLGVTRKVGWSSAVVFVGVLIVAAPALGADRVYWANEVPVPGAISFANLDGTGGGGQLDTTGATVSGAFGLTMDPAANKIYWTNFTVFGPNAISFANLDGTGGGGQLDTSGAVTPFGPRGAAVDPAANKIYWANGFPQVISFANLDDTGGGGQLDTAGAPPSQPWGVAIDPAANKIYWADNGANAILSANLDGTGGGGLLDTTGATLNGPLGLAIDPAANKIYWANEGNNTISFANLDGTGGGGELDTTGATVSVPQSVAIDPAANKIYWTNDGNNTISFANLDDTGGGGQLNTTGAPIGVPKFLVLLETPSGAGAPVLSGGSTTGSTLSCSQGVWAADLLGAFLYRAPASYSYAWTLGGTTIPGATSTTIVAGSPGDYACQVTAHNQAGATSQTSAAHTVSSPAAPTTAKPPTATTGPATNIAQTSAVLTGTVNPNGSATTYYFQYGTSTAYSKQTSAQNAGSDTTTRSASVSISALLPGTTYHVRIVAMSAAGTTDGTDQTFTTSKRPLKLSVSPTHTQAGTRACFAFKASSNGDPVGAATVHFARHTARTSHTGRATICVTLNQGTYHPSATRAGYRSARTTVKVSAAPKPIPTFTG